jgi:iron(III) transport system substrate-binding protein
LCLGGLSCVLAGCFSGSDVVAYTALDREFAETLLADFTKQTGIRAEPLFDSESTKTVGLVNRIRAEAGRPRCDVFWNNEIVNTLRLKREGLLQPCHPPNAADYDAQWKDADAYWYGFAARARVLIVNTQRVAADRTPDSMFALIDPAWKGQGGIAKPLFGTTATHMACLHAAVGGDGLRSFLAGLKSNNVSVLGGNKACAEAVSAGRLSFALTDTDDAIIELDAGRPVKIVFPDTGANRMGTLVLPNTLAVVKGAPHPQAAEKLINFLLSPEVEARLAAGPSAQIPLNRKSPAASRVGKLADLRAMKTDLSKAAEEFDAAARLVQQALLD